MKTEGVMETKREGRRVRKGGEGREEEGVMEPNSK